MFGGDTFKRKTKIKKDRGSSSDQGGQYHEKTKIKEKRKGVKGTTVGTTSGGVGGLGSRLRGRRQRSASSSSSSSDNRRRTMGTGNVGGPIGYAYTGTGVTQGFGSPGTSSLTQGYGTTGTTSYTQGYGSNVPHVDTLQAPSTNYTAKQKGPGFVQKIKYKLRSRNA